MIFTALSIDFRGYGNSTYPAEPKQIKIYPGNTHAQHLFKTGVGDELSERIISFIMKEQPE